MSRTARIDIRTDIGRKKVIVRAAELTGADVTQFILDRVVPDAERLARKRLPTWRVQFVEASLDFGLSGTLVFVPTRIDLQRKRYSTDGKAGARMSREVSSELQSLRDSYPCPGIAIRATRLFWAAKIREKTFAVILRHAGFVRVIVHWVKPFADLTLPFR